MHFRPHVYLKLHDSTIWQHMYIHIYTMYEGNEINYATGSTVHIFDVLLLLSGFLFHSCLRNPSLLIVQQH